MAALALLVALPARAAEVVSSNIVGYSKLQAPANKMVIVGNQFKKVGDNNAVLNIQDIKPDSFNPDGSDWLNFWDPANGYTMVYWWGDPDDGIYDPSDTEYENSLGVGWGTADQFKVDFDVNVGRGFWAQSVEGGTVVDAGEVPSSTSVPVSANTMDLVCNPLPMAVNLQKIVPEGFSPDGSDWINVWDSENGYTMIYWWGDPEDGIYDPSDTEYDNSLGVGWGTADQFKVDRTIKIGEGFWVQSVTGGTLTFPTEQ